MDQHHDRPVLRPAQLVVRHPSRQANVGTALRLTGSGVQGADLTIERAIRDEDHQ